MAYSGVLNDVCHAVSLAVPERLPTFLCSEEFDVRACRSRYDLYCRNASEMARVQIEAVERFDYDWAWLQVDDCIEFEPLGVGVKGEGDILPATFAYLPPTETSLETLREHGYRVQGRMEVLLEAIRTVKAHFGDAVCVTGRTAAPFSSATLAFGMSDFLAMVYERPEFVSAAVGFFEDYQLRFGLDQLRAGADAIWFGDCNASGHLISPEIYRAFAMEPARRVSAGYREADGIVIYHASEESPALLDLQAGAGFSILSAGPGIDIGAARDIVKGRVCLSGNVDPLAVLQRGTPHDVRGAVERTIEHVSRHGGHVLNSGEMIPRDTPEANIRAFVETARTAWATVR